MVLAPWAIDMLAADIKPRIITARTARDPARRKRGLPFYHYTLNTGEARELRRGPLSRRTAKTLADLAERGGGSFAGILSAFACCVEPAIQSGTRMFWILRNDEPILFCVICWDAQPSGAAFGVVERAYQELLLESCCAPRDPDRALVEHAPAMPTRVPWVARLLLRHSNALPSGETAVLEELERCLIWTLFQSSAEAR